MSSVHFESLPRPFEAPLPPPNLIQPELAPRPPLAKAPERPLFGLRQLEVQWEETSGTLWTHMRFDGRPSYNPDLLLDFQAWQGGIQAMFAGRQDDLRYLVLGSRFPGVFCFGGDLNRFAGWIRRRDRKALVHYGTACVRILHRNMAGLDLPVVTIALVQGDALGGGFESALSFNLIVAEKGAKFGFPENLFGLFPGMGAYSLLARRLGSARAEAMILSGRTYTAEEMHEMGVVQVLAEPGEGAAAVRDYINRHGRRHGGQRAVFRAAREVNPVSLGELERIVEIWADAALQLREKDLRVMERLVGAQDRLLGVPAAAAE